MMKQHEKGASPFFFIALNIHIVYRIHKKENLFSYTLYIDFSIHIVYTIIEDKEHGTPHTEKEK